MTTAGKLKDRTIKARLKGKMPVEGQRGVYLDVQVVQPGKGRAPDGGRLPETYKCWDPKQLEHLSLNQEAIFILRCDGLKPKSDDDGQVGSYWWSIAGVAEDDATPPEPPQGTKDSAPPQTTTAAVRFEQTMMADHPSKRRSIERQTALGQAVQLGIAQVITFDQLLPAAEKFYRFISGTLPDEEATP